MADLLPSIPDSTPPEDAEPRVVGLDDDDADDVLGALSSTTARELFAALNDDPAHPSALAERVDTSLQNVQYHLGKLDDAGMVEVVDTAYSEKGREMDVYAPADRPLVLFAGDEEDETLLNRALGRLLGGVGVLAGATLSVRGLVGADETGETTPTGEFAGTPLRSGGGSGDDGDDAAAGADADGVESEDTAGDDGGGMDGAGDAGSADDGGATADGGAYSADNVSGDQLDISGELQGTGGDGVEPLAQQIAWMVEPLEASGLPPEFAVFALGAVLLTVVAGAWYWRVRQTRV